MEKLWSGWAGRALLLLQDEDSLLPAEDAQGVGTMLLADTNEGDGMALAGLQVIARRAM